MLSVSAAVASIPATIAAVPVAAVPVAAVPGVATVVSAAAVVPAGDIRPGIAREVGSVAERVAGDLVATWDRQLRAYDAEHVQRRSRGELRRSEGHVEGD